MGRAVGIDLGGTKTMGVLLVDGEVVARCKKATPRKGGPDDVLAVVAAVVDAVDPGGGAPLGIGVPGPVRPGSGRVPAAPNLPGWDHEVAVADELARLTGRRVVVDNDVNVGTLAEHRLGAGRGTDDLLGVFVGTGVGAGLVLDGRLRHGPRGLAGEIGHTFVAFRDLRDPEVPGRGELEDYAGRNALERRARHLHEQGRPTLLVELAGRKRMKSRIWAEAVEAGDEVATELVADAASALAAALASVVALVDVERVVLGGGLAERLGRPFRTAVEAELAERAFAGGGVPVVPAALGDVGGAIGAALRVGDEGGPRP
ncbi:MAG: ROK family protein [Actinomyces sp.]|nr:MAG: ROK family protein [Actinomyces sp.]